MNESIRKAVRFILGAKTSQERYDEGARLVDQELSVTKLAFRFKTPAVQAEELQKATDKLWKLADGGLGLNESAGDKAFDRGVRDRLSVLGHESPLDRSH